MYAEMKHYEAEEDYEVCAELKSYIEMLGAFTLGYSTYEEVEPLIYWYIKLKGTILKMSYEGFTHYVHFLYSGSTWKFEVDKEELIKLQQIEDEEVQKAINKK